MRIRTTYKALAVLVLSLGAANAVPRGNIAPASHICPYGSAYADGCAAYPIGGQYQITNASLVSDGGTNIQGSHPEPFNIPGIDYSIANTTAEVSLSDPSAGGLPTGCTYNVNFNGTNKPAVDCASVASPTINGWNFNKGPANCIMLVFENTVTGTITISNSVFRMGAGCDTTFGALIRFKPNSAAARVLTSNLIDGNTPNYHHTGNWVAEIWEDIRSLSGGCRTWHYNAIINAIGRPSSSSTTGCWDIRWNAFVGMGLDNTEGQHLEIIQDNTPTSLVTSIAYDFNLTVQPHTAPPGSIGGAGAAVWATFAAVAGTTVTDYEMIGNVEIINKASDNTSSLSRAFLLSGDTFTNTTAKLNYLYVSGAFFCFENDANGASGAPTFTNSTIWGTVAGGDANISLFNGSLITNWHTTASPINPAYACQGHI